MKSALFGISIGNKNFSRDVVTRCFNETLLQYDRIIFLIADRIQAYNFMAKHKDDITGAFQKWRNQSWKYASERKAWLARIRSRLGKAASKQEWLIEAVDDIADYRYVTAHRNVCILYDLDEGFSADVDKEVDIFIERREGARHDLEDLVLWRRLSTKYILEEIALNMFVRCKHHVYDEYYAGGYLPLVVDKMLRNEYKGSMADLLGTTKNSNAEHTLFL